MADRVLVVDDGLMNRQILASILGKAGLECLLASDGSEALRSAREHRPDLVLLDIVMPGKNGYEVCAELKANPRTTDIPVIFLSSLDEAADKIKGLSAGAADYVAKPFDAGEVLARVRTQLRMRHLTRSLQSLNHHLIEKQRCLDEDLKAAAHIQSALIPRDLLRSASNLPLAAVRERLREALEVFGAGVAAGDDISFLALEYHGPD